MTTTPFGYMMTKTQFLKGLETESEVEIMATELRIRVVYALAKIGVSASVGDVRIRRVHIDGCPALVGSCDWDPPEPEMRQRLIEAYDDGQRAGHEYQAIKDRGHPTQIRLLPLIKESPYRPGGHCHDDDDPETCRVLDVAWMRGFFVGCAHEKSPGIKPFKLPY